MTIESRELFELCSEVYKRTGWDNDGNLDSLHKDGGIYTKDAAWLYSRNYVPLYTSDYLLEKLPEGIRKLSSGNDGWYASYETHTMNSVASEYADTPLKALLKLCLKIHEEKIL